LNDDQIQKLVEGAHDMCPYSRAIKGNVPVKLTIGTFSLSISAIRQMDEMERKKLMRFEWFGSNSLEK